VPQTSPCGRRIRFAAFNLRDRRPVRPIKATPADRIININARLARPVLCHSLPNAELWDFGNAISKL